LVSERSKGDISKEESLTLGKIRNEASEVVGLLLSSLNDLDEGIEIALDGGEKSRRKKKKGQ
jgi:hypothetical protein